MAQAASPLSSPSSSGAVVAPGALALWVSFYTLALSLFSALTGRFASAFPIHHSLSHFPHSAFPIPHLKHPFFQFCRLLDRLMPLRSHHGGKFLPPEAAPDPILLARLAEQSRLELERLAGAAVDYAQLAAQGAPSFSLGPRTSSSTTMPTATNYQSRSLKSASLFSDAVFGVRQRVAAFARHPRRSHSINPIDHSSALTPIPHSEFRIPHSSPVPP